MYFSRTDLRSLNFRYETLKSPLLKKPSVYHLFISCESQTIKAKCLLISRTSERMNMNEYMIELECF